MLSDWYHVRFDERSVYRDVSPPGGVPWSDSLEWTSVVRVCFLAQGLFESDELYIFTSQRDESYVIPMEAAGSQDLLDELMRRKLMPPEILIEAAIAENRLFCWPPSDEGSE